MSFYTFRGFSIPDYMVESLTNYVERGVHPGSFLTSVVCNDLAGACSAADDNNLLNLPAYVAYLYNVAPAGCWGSEERMQEWLNKFHDEGVSS